MREERLTTPWVGPIPRLYASSAPVILPIPLGPITAESVVKVPGSYGQAFSIAWANARARLVDAATRRGAGGIVGLTMSSTTEGEFYRATLTGLAIHWPLGSENRAPILSTMSLRDCTLLRTLGYEPIGQALATVGRTVSMRDRLGTQTLPFLYANVEYRMETTLLDRLRRQVMNQMASVLHLDGAIGVLDVLLRHERHPVNGGVMMVMVALGTGIRPLGERLSESSEPRVRLTQEVAAGCLGPDFKSREADSKGSRKP